MAEDNSRFGVPEGSGVHVFLANYKGPLIPLKIIDAANVQLVATHEDAEATLGLTGSAQALTVDTSVVPNRVSGEASFFTDGDQDVLHCTFHGSVPGGLARPEPQRAFVHVVFTGGTGRFEHATGTGIVEADLHPTRGFSEGKILGNVILPPA